MSTLTATGIRDVAVALLALIVAACSAGPAPLEKTYSDGYRQLEAGNLGAAKALAEDGLRQAKSTGDDAWSWAFEVLDAEVLVGQRNITAALLSRLDAGLSVERPHDRVLVRALMTSGFARCYAPDGDSEPDREEARTRAQTDLEKAEQIAEFLRSPRLVAEATLRRGTCAALRDDSATAEALFRKTMKAAQRQGFRLIEAKAAGNLGNLLARTAEYDDAVRWLRRSEELTAGLPAGATRARNLGRLGWCYLLLGDYERAVEVLQEAKALMRTLDLPGDRRIVLENLGRALQGQGDHAGARQSYAGAAAIAKTIKDREGSAEALASIQATRAALALERASYGEAAFHAEEALRIQDEHRLHTGRPRTLLLLGEVWERRGESSRATARYNQVIGLSKADSDLVWEAHAGLARLHARAQRPAEAEAEYRRAFALMEVSLAQMQEPEHQLPFIANMGRFYDDYVDFLVAQGRTADALRVADESRARLLRERLRGTGAVPGHPVDYPRLARKANALLLFYSIAPERSFLWAVTADGITLVRLPGEKALSADVAAHQRLILSSRDPLDEAAPEATALYRLLVEPVASAMTSKARVIIVSDGPLEQLNFETLVVPDLRPHYLIEDAVLARTPSLRLLQTESPSSPARERSLLVLGDPVSADPEFPMLPFAGKEVASIAALFEPEHRRILTGVRAIPSAYRNADPQRFAYIHLAAHAQANSVVPLDSSVVLSADAGEYKLYARDVIAVPLNAELVTLSTCRSAGARTFSGEGLVGLSWAFLSAGGKRVIGGLWPVEDASTAELMTDLYRRIASGAEPVAALRQAKLALLHSDTAYRKPYYWAPFVVYVSGSRAQ
jgi:CHAT domain-containing protein